MVITIEDAPSIKHISIDINFDGSETPEVELKTSGTSKIQKKSNTNIDTFNDSLDLDEKFDASTEIVNKPKIEEPDRDVKVSEDMINSEF